MTKKKTIKSCTVIYRDKSLVILNLSSLSTKAKNQIKNIFQTNKLEEVAEEKFTNLIVRDIKKKDLSKYALEIAQISGTDKKQQITKNQYSTKITFSKIDKLAKNFAEHLSKNRTEISSALEGFETHNVVFDEIERSIDHLINLAHNKPYFEYQIDNSLAFLPLNQPLYALVCFGIVPSFMTKTVYVRPPEMVQPHFKKLDKVLNLAKFFPNLRIHYGDRPSFYKLTHEHEKSIDVIIFTGRASNAKAVKKQYSPKLFIFNGSGHNPVVISNNAEIKKAVASTLSVAFQNQGQDCAGPNSILVHQDIYKEYKTHLISEVEKILPRVGSYQNKNNIIGPNSNPSDLPNAFATLYKYKDHCIFGGSLNIRTNTIDPTIFEVPLHLGGNYSEFYAPIIMLQPYSSDNDLNQYFEHQEYAKNAMYITVFGTSKYIQSLEGSHLHSSESILWNTNLHKEERGFKPYGGLGSEASYIQYRDKKITGSTLPQRDIHKILIKQEI